MEIGLSHCTAKAWAKKKQAKKYHTRRDFRKATPNGGRLRSLAYWDSYHGWRQKKTRIEIECDEEINPIEEYLNIRNPNDNDIQSNLHDILHNTNPSMIKYEKCDNDRYRGSNSRCIWTIHYEANTLKKYNDIENILYHDKDNYFNHNKYFRIGAAMDKNKHKKDTKGGNNLGCTLIIKEKRKDIKFGLKRDGGMWNSNDWRRYGAQLYRRAYKRNVTHIKKQWHNKRSSKDWDMDIVKSRYDHTDPDDDVGQWKCTQCTYINFASSFCCMCMAAFDYNHQNNQNDVHYNDENSFISLPMQYKSNKISVHKRKNVNIHSTMSASISKQSIIAQADTFSTNGNHDYVLESAKYRKTINNNRKSKNKQQNKAKNNINENMEWFDIEISIVVTKYNEYEYVKNKLFDNVKQGTFWVDVPMQLINTKLHHCCLKIIPNNPQLHNAKNIYFEPMITDFFIPIYTTEYLFIFQHDPIPTILKNNKLFRMIKHCMGQCCIQNINFDRNISIHSFNLYSILFEYLPAMDILSNVLCPFVGYSQAICIKTNVKNAQINKTKFIQQNNDEWNPIDDRYKSSLHSIIWTPIPNKNKTHAVIDTIERSESTDSETMHKLFSESSSSDTVPLFIKYLNGYTDDDTDSRSDMDSDFVCRDRDVGNKQVKNTANVLFKAPYRFCRNSRLFDDDPDRDLNWWKAVKYKSKSKSKYQLNDKVKVRYYNVRWDEATIVRVTMKGVWIKKSYSLHEEFIPKHQFELKLKLVSAVEVGTDKINQVHDKSMDRKRKAYSKASRNYFSLNRR